MSRQREGSELTGIGGLMIACMHDHVVCKFTDKNQAHNQFPSSALESSQQVPGQQSSEEGQRQAAFHH